MDERLQHRLDTERRDAPSMESIADLHYLNIPGGRLRAFHARPATVEAARPIVMVPGFGVVPSGWHDWWTVLHDRAEIFYIETREKPGSELKEEEGADLSMSALIADIELGLEHFDLVGRDFVLMGTSWGATALMAGLAERRLDTRKTNSVVAWNPLDHIWFSRWALRHVTPRIPFSVIDRLRGVISGVALAGMAPAQRERLMGFVNAADWRWKGVAETQVDFELSEVAATITQEILIFVGVNERIHSSEASELLTASIPRGRLFQPVVSEEDNTRLAGLVNLELARITCDAPLPQLLASWERAIRHTH